MYSAAWLLALGLWLGSVGETASAQSGKIAGQILDAATGVALPGVTVRVEGTSWGAASDTDGQFALVGIRPGTHTLVVSMVGYATTRVEGVEVQTDRTARVDVRLSEQVIEGEEIVVSAQRPLVEIDRTTSASYVNADAIDQLPVQEVSDLLQLQAGVVYDAAGRLHLRGGRAGEVAYLIDGIPVTDQFDGGSKIEIENSWIQELQVISGTFNAEYGQAQSGVVNIVSKEGGVDAYSGRLSSYVGTYVTARDEIFPRLGGPGIDQINTELSLEGPLRLLPGGSFYLSGRRFSTDGWLYGERRVRIEDTVPIQAYIHEVQRQASDRDALIGIRVPDSLMGGDRAAVPMNDNGKWALNGRVSMEPFASGKFSYAVFLNDSERRSYSDFRRYAPDGQPTTYVRSWNHIASFTHTLSSSTFYQLGGSYQTHRTEQRLFDDPLDPRYQGPAYPANGFAFGGTSNGRTTSDHTTLLAKADLTSQVGRWNLVKFGATAQRHRVGYRQLTTISDGPVYQAPRLRLPDETTAGNDSYEQRPLELAAYVQDKIELGEVIVNAGFRFDYWNPNAAVPADPEAVTRSGGIRLDTELEDAVTSRQFSPRIGLAFPISSRGVLHVSYGHFFQVPRFQYIFANSEFEVELGDLETIMGNANLKPERTVAYEMGVQQAVAADWKVELTVYAKDIRNLLGQEIISTRDKKVYARYVNRDYGHTRGVTAALIKPFSGGYAVTVDYTYQVARGNASDPNAVFFNNQTRPPKEPEKQVLPLDWDQRHAVNGTLILGTGRRGTLSLIGRFVTGQPYTPTNPGSQLSDQLSNSERRPSRLTLDVNLNRTVRLAAVPVRAFIRAYNVLDALNPIRVYTSTGDPARPYRTLGETEVLRQNPNFSLDEIDLRPDFYEEPRRVVVGLDIRF